MAKIERFEDLEIWQKARIICEDIFKIGENSKLKNIAEGFERNGNKEFNKFLSIAKAPCGETRSQLYRLLDRNYITHEEFELQLDKLTMLSKQIRGFLICLQKSDYKGSKFK